MVELEVFKDYKRILKFLSVGAVGLIVETFVLFIMVEYLDIWLLLSKLIAVEAAIIAVFFLNDSFTFQEFEKNAYALLRTNLVRSGGIIISVSGLYLGVYGGLHYLLANVLGVAAGSLFNYYFERKFTWSRTSA